MKEFLNKTLSLLRQDRLREAMDVMESRLLADRDATALDQLRRLRESYTLMLDYMVKGYDDPGRERLFSTVKEELYSMVRRIKVAPMIEESPLMYFSQARRVRGLHLNFSDVLGRYMSLATTLELVPEDSPERKRLLDEKDEVLRDIFSIAWTVSGSDRESISKMAATAVNPDMAREVTDLIVAGLTQNTLYIYERCKLLALLDIESKAADDHTKAEALTGILLVLNKYYDRLPDDYELRMRFEAWTEDLTNYARLRAVVMSLARVRGAARLLSRLEKDFLPGFQTLGKDLMDKLKDSKGQISFEELEENPEWQKMMENAHLDKKMKRLNAMRDNGADLMVKMVANVAGSRDLYNPHIWFRPFDSDEGIRLGIPDGISSFLSDQTTSAALCQPDRYAMGLTFRLMPAATRDMLMNNLRSQAAEMTDQMKALAESASLSDFDSEAYNYARTLFRFHTYHQKHTEFHDPFRTVLRLADIPYLRKLLDDSEIMTAVAELSFHQGFYDDAIAIYRQLMDYPDQSRPLLLQKMGYCHEKNGQLREALDLYLQADRYAENDRWLDGKIMQLSRRLGMEDSELAAIDHLLSGNPDDAELLARQAELNLKLAEASLPSADPEEYLRLTERLAKTRQSLARLRYDFPDDERFTPLLALCDLLSGNTASSLDLLSGTLEDADMYLASNALGAAAGSSGATPGEAHSSAEEAGIAGRLILLACAHAASGRNSDAIAALNKITPLRASGLSRSDVRSRLTSIWSAVPNLADRLSLIPLLLEA
ncbi:MAG: hypothetical protein HDR80_02490 [Bacteroides sp.]|nr:hypothetical protein [Bacteroides sp.]